MKGIKLLFVIGHILNFNGDKLFFFAAIVNEKKKKNRNKGINFYSFVLQVLIGAENGGNSASFQTAEIKKNSLWLKWKYFASIPSNKKKKKWNKELE